MNFYTELADALTCLAERSYDPKVLLGNQNATLCFRCEAGRYLMHGDVDAVRLLRLLLTSDVQKHLQCVHPALAAPVRRASGLSPLVSFEELLGMPDCVPVDRKVIMDSVSKFVESRREVIAHVREMAILYEGVRRSSLTGKQEDVSHALDILVTAMKLDDIIECGEIMRAISVVVEGGTRI